MPSSDFIGFNVNFETKPGIIPPVGAGVEVIVYDVLTDTDIDTLTTDGSGDIAAGTVAVAAGSEVRFRVENYFGMAFSIQQTTT